jgi:lipopolysaccharide export system protein LptC
VRQRQPFIWRLQAWLANYLPLALMALLALFSFWLLRQTPVPGGPTEERPLRHVPDYEMRGFELQRFLPDGSRQARLYGAVLRHYPDTDSIEIERLQLHLVADDGRLVLAEAERAQGPAQGETLNLEGKVRVRRFALGVDPASAAPEMELRTEALTARIKERRLLSRRPTELVAPGLQLQARGLDYHHASGQLLLQGPTRSVFTKKRP